MKRLILIAVLFLTAPVAFAQGTKTILFMVDKADDALVLAFSRENECSGLATAFLFDRKPATWAVAWVGNERGRTEVYLEDMRVAKYVFLGSNPHKAVRAACQIIKGSKQSIKWIAIER